MNQIQTPPNLSLIGNLHENWKRFKQRFELYIQAIGAEKKSDEQKIGLFLTVAGPETIEVYNTLEFTDDEKGKYEIVVKKVGDYCTPRKNETYERYVFRSRMQMASETFEQFVTDLKIKSQSCNFGVLSESLIKDQIVIGITDKKVKERLLRESDLDLKKAIQICQAAETAKIQLKTIQSQENEALVGAVNTKKPNKYRESRLGTKNTSNPQHNDNYKKRDQGSRGCQRCGWTHEWGKCPAYGKSCNRCHQRGHFERMCQNRDVGSLEKEEQSDTNSDSEEFFMGAINSQKNQEKDWMSKVTVNGQEILFKVDTGAQTNVLPLKEYRKLVDKPKIEQKNIVLRSYTGEQIPVMGVCYPDIECNNQKGKEVFVVVPQDCQPILGLDCCERYKFINRLHTVHTVEKVISESQMTTEFKDVFEGIGCLPVTYKIQLREDAVPVIHPARKVPIALQDRLKTELNRLTELGIVKKIEEPTEWVSSLVIVEKANGDLRLCLDPKELNEYIMREHYHIPTRSEVTNDMAGAKYFSKLDATSGFWQIPLDESSTKLCTFNTPYGRYCFLRLPFGISSAPEVFHRTVEQLFEAMDGVKSVHDDILIWGKTMAEHDEHLRTALVKAREVGLKLNQKKCRFRVQELTFLGDKITSEGVLPDSKKVEAINKMPQPTSQVELQRYLGMVNYLGKFVPNLSSKTVALRSLLEEKHEWQWQPEHEREWNHLKGFLTTEPVLKFYDPAKRTKISSDASKTGLGAVLLQEHEGMWKPVAYASRVLTQAEQRYATIEKESLGMVFACEKFHEFIYGVQEVIAETDHKPLITIVKKSLCDTPPRIQRLMLRLQKYNLNCVYTPGKYLVVADTLSRAYLQSPSDYTSDREVEIHVNMVKESLPVTESKWKEIAKATTADKELQSVIKNIDNGWEQGPFPKPYYHFRDELTVIDGVILKNNHIVVPSVLRQDMLNKIHEGHMGIEKCRRRGRSVLYWPNMNRDIEDKVSACAVCQKYRNQQQKEPLLMHDVPNTPWIKVGADLFKLEGKDYLLVVDYMSSYPEIALLAANTTSRSVITHMKSIGARHGIPRTLVTDNGPQFASEEFKVFTSTYGIEHKFSSPYHPKANGQAEKGVGIVKNLLRKSLETKEDPYLALLAYRSTPLDCGKSPAELCMNRQLRTTLPDAAERKVDKDARATKERSKQKEYYDKRAKPLRQLKLNETVRIRGDRCWSKKAVVVEETSPRAYKVKTEDGVVYERNRIHLLPTKEKFEETLDNMVDEELTTDYGNPATNEVATPTIRPDPTVLRRSQRQRTRPERLIEKI